MVPCRATRGNRRILGDAILGKDLNGIIQSWNTGAQQLFGYRPEEVIGKPTFWQIPNDSKPMLTSRVAGLPLIKHAPKCRAQQSIQGLVQTITGKTIAIIGTGRIGLAMIESIAIYCFVIAIILIFANPFWNKVVSIPGG